MEKRTGNKHIDAVLIIIEVVYDKARKPQQLLLTLFVIAFVVIGYFYVKHTEGEHKELSETNKNSKLKTELEIIALKRAIDSAIKRKDSIMLDCIERERSYNATFRKLDSINDALREQLK